MHHYSLHVIALASFSLFILPTAQPAEVTPDIQITSWNRASRRFIDPPVFDLTPIPAAAAYRADIGQGEKHWSVKSSTPSLDFTPIWNELQTGAFDLTFHALIESGESLMSTESAQRFKAPDWSGWDGKAADWAAAADRNIAYLIDVGSNGAAPYKEPGAPVWVWSPAGPEPDNPQGRDDAYPALHLPMFIEAFLSCERLGRPAAAETRRLAEVAADWLLNHRRPDSGALPLFPFSTISRGKYEGDVEGSAITLMRSSTVGTALVVMFEATGREGFLDYAAHIAATTIKLQREDGSFPYRVDPVSGRAVEGFTCHAIDFIMLADALRPHRPDPARDAAARRALEWMMAEVVAKHYWQGAYEDVREQAPYANLENRAAAHMIQYLCRHADENKTYIDTAEHINRWVEDQFVVFGADESVPLRCPTPMVIEQYVCNWPMEVHTAEWILALLSLHEATGKEIYLEKAKAAGNAICASQFPNGEFSTWGVDTRTGKQVNPLSNWYGCNALASEGLYRLAEYAGERK